MSETLQKQYLLKDKSSVISSSSQTGFSWWIIQVTRQSTVSTYIFHCKEGLVIYCGANKGPELGN
jgi:hypothetical protein